MSKKYNVAILGATGAVGQEFLKILEERNFPIESLKLLSSKRSAGKKMSFKGAEMTVEEATSNSFEGIDLVLSSAGGSVSKELAPYAVKAGALVVDNTSAFRMDPTVPLVVPEINPEDVSKHQGIIANPNCSTIIMLVPLAPIHKLAKIKRIVVSTYQAASGAGVMAMEELKEQTRQVLGGKEPTQEAFPHQIAFNLFSHNSAIGPDGFCEEEVKMIRETEKIFHDETIDVCATTIRVPVVRAHSEVINIETEKEISSDEVRKLMSEAAGVRLVDDRQKNHFPMPIEAEGRDDVFVGRIRRDPSVKNGLVLFVSGDQIRKGAALNAVQIAEVWIKNQSTVNRP